MQKIKQLETAAAKQQQSEFYIVCTEVLQQKDTPNEFQAIRTNIAAKLKKMDPSQQILAENLTNKVLMKGLFKELTRETDVIHSMEYVQIHQLQQLLLCS